MGQVSRFLFVLGNTEALCIYLKAQVHDMYSSRGPNVIRAQVEARASTCAHGNRVEPVTCDVRSIIIIISHGVYYALTSVEYLELYSSSGRDAISDNIYHWCRQSLIHVRQNIIL